MRAVWAPTLLSGVLGSFGRPGPCGEEPTSPHARPLNAALGGLPSLSSPWVSAQLGHVWMWMR